MMFPLTVRDYLDRAEHVYPDRPGLLDEPNQPAPSLGDLSYRQVAELARAQASKLDQLGVPEGGRVAMMSENSARLMTSFFGVCGSGRVLVPINFRLASSELQYIVAHSGAEVVYVDPDHASVLDSLDVAHKFVLGEDDDLYLRGVEPRDWAGDESATATINYTSGTTARPKGVEVSHRSLWLNAAVFGLHLGVRDRDVYLHTLPLFHANGWGMPFVMTGVGGRHVILRKIDGDEILRRVAEHGVTIMCAAPAVLNAVLDAAQEWNGPVPGRGTVRIVVGGAPPPSRTIERVLDELGWEFIQGYGLSETPLLTINRQRAEWDTAAVPELAQKLGRAGVPALGVKLATSVDGEVLAQTNHLLRGYWQQIEATDQAMAGSWFHTGDGGILDSEGYLVIADRKKDVIISGGENVSSIEVESVLMSHPGIKDVAVIGIPDEQWGELVTALVVAEGRPPSADDVIAFCRSKLAGYKCPKRVDFVGGLPRTTTGKLQKFKLREPFWARRDDGVN